MCTWLKYDVHNLEIIEGLKAFSLPAKGPRGQQ